MSEDKRLDDVKLNSVEDFDAIPLIDLNFGSVDETSTDEGKLVVDEITVDKEESVVGEITVDKEESIVEEPIVLDNGKKHKKEALKNTTGGNFALTPELFFIAFMVLMELLFHLMRFGFTGKNLLYKLLFAAFYGLVFGSIISIVPKKVGKILNYVLVSITTIYFIAQLIYSGVFDTYLSLTGTLEVAGQALDFTDVIWKEVAAEWWKILFMLAPLLSLIIVLSKKVIRFDRHSLKRYGIQLVSAAVILLVSLGIMKATSKELYSPYEVYKNYTSVNMSVEKLGVLESFYLDTKEGIRNKLGIEKKDLSFDVVDVELPTTEAMDDGIDDIIVDGLDNQIGNPENNGDGNTNSELPEEKVIDTSPNVLDLDMDYLIENEPNGNIKAIHEYVKMQTPTKKNEYTGMFEGYNLIFVVAEGFSGYVIDKNRTPMLYQMSREGFYFKNYYTPLWYGSTLGGEYADLTGLMPKNGTYLSMARAGSHKNDMYFTLSRQLERQGYAVRGYHNNDYTYYDRNISHPNMGYDWKGMGNGLEYEKDGGSTLWPQSDLKMINDTFDDYVNDQPFHTYYLTVSGHVMYNFGGNAMAKKHKDFVENLDYSDTTKAYIACQYELELAMEELVDRLEKAGVADRTLIVLTADHVPYDNKEVVDELAGQALDNTFGWYKNNLIIWSASMEEPVIVEKHCSSLDILPTVSNLMGLPYDSRMLVGQDIMSDNEGLILFNDRSFMTDNMSYNANTGEVKSFNGAVIGEDYVEAMKVIVKNKFSMAEAINENDYYKYIHEALEENEEE